MKICISVTNDVFTDQRVNRIVRSLMKAGYIIQVIGRKRKSLHSETYPCAITRFSLLFNKGPLFYAEYNLRLFTFLLFAKVDVMLACDLDTLPANFLAAGIRSKKLVYDSHEYFTEVPELVGRKRTRKIWECIENKLLPRIRYACTVSQSIADAYYSKYGIKMNVVFNYPYKITSLTEPGFKLKKKNERIVLYQGSVNVGRGLELVILAMKYIEDCRLVIIGDGDILSDLMKLSDDAGLSDRITFSGRVSILQLPLYTVQADLGISLEEDLGLNYHYALPNKLFDYIQAGVPVLVSDLPEMAAVVNKYDIGKTIRTTDPRELASCLSEMLNNLTDRERWKGNLRNAADQLHWEKEEGKLLEIFRQFESG